MAIAQPLIWNSAVLGKSDEELSGFGLDPNSAEGSAPVTIWSVKSRCSVFKSIFAVTIAEQSAIGMIAIDPSVIRFMRFFQLC